MNPGQVITDIYKEMLAFLASKAGVLVPDGQDLAGVLLLIVVSWSVLMWLLTSDGVHMNPAGNRLMATGVLKAFGLNARQLKKAQASW